jgi:hypothetical protein
VSRDHKEQRLALTRLGEGASRSGSGIVLGYGNIQNVVIFLQINQLTDCSCTVKIRQIVEGECRSKYGTDRVIYTDSKESGFRQKGVQEAWV